MIQTQMNDGYTLVFWLAVFCIGWLAIAQGLYWVKTGKARAYWFKGFRVIPKEKEPGVYWAYVGLSIGVGILVVAVALEAVIRP